MKIPKEIREKIEQRIRLNEELDTWFRENLDIEGCDHRDVQVVDEATGEEQLDGEYCDQIQHGDDWFSAKYYWEMDNGKYLCMNFESY